MQLQGRHVAVIGAGSSGQAAAKLCRQKGAEVRLLDSNSECLNHYEQELLLKKGIAIELGEHRSRQLEGVQMVILSPGVALHHLRRLLPVPASLAVYSELELALWFIRGPVIAVTGTNGKTTTAQIIARILGYAGREVFLGGNIGVPLSEYVLQKRPAEVLVLEASSFQLMHTYSLRPKIGILLNFSVNHLDYHQNLQEYLQAKLRLFQNQTQKDLALLPLEMKPELESQAAIRGKQVYFEPGTDLRCEQLPGEHNAQNLQAAYLACNYFQVSKKDMQKALQDYQQGPHRLQILGENQGVLFVDDSKATTVHALQAALKSFTRPVLLLAGGKFKGGDPACLQTLIKSRVKAAGLYGESQEIFDQAWSGCTEIFREQSLEQAARRLISMAQSGDVVLLSPATASFDQFRDYKHRGKVFQEIVQDYL